jgi:hypothetical protein
MKDNFDLKKFILENKTMENSNQFTKSSTNKKPLTEGNLRDKIREMILKEMGDGGVEDYELEDRKTEYGIDPENYEETEDFINPGNAEEDNIKRKEYLDRFGEPDFLSEEEEDEVDIEDEETEEEPIEDEDESAFGTIAADMEGSEAELMDNLMAALKAAKGLNNEKLTTQIGNTLKFFVSEYIGGEEQ